MFFIISFSIFWLCIVPLVLFALVPKFFLESSLCMTYYETYNHLAKPHKRLLYYKQNYHQLQMLTVFNLFSKMLAPETSQKDKEIEFQNWISTIETNLADIDQWDDIPTFYYNLKEFTKQCQSELDHYLKAMKELRNIHRENYEKTRLQENIDLYNAINTLIEQTILVKNFKLEEI